MEIKPIFYDVTQNTDEWMELKLGKFSSSNASDLFMDKKTKGYQDLITKIAFEKITGKTQLQFTNKWMDYGHETEPEAAENYCIETFNELENGGIWVANDYVCSSPDRKIVGISAGTEFKCPSWSTYIAYLESFEKLGKIELPKDYFYQVHHQLMCTGWEYIDYMPYVNANIKQLLCRVERDESIIKILIEKTEEAIFDVENLINKIKR